MKYFEIDSITCFNHQFVLHVPGKVMTWACQNMLCINNMSVVTNERWWRVEMQQGTQRQEA